MRALRAWIVRLGGLLRTGRRERELRAEIESHLQFHIDDNIRAGMSPEEARRLALIRFGPVEAIKDEYRDRAGIPVLDLLSQDLRYGLRRLGRHPGSTLLVALTLGLGIGANAAMLDLVDALMFRTPAHVREPERIVTVAGAVNYVQYQALREQLQSVDVAAHVRQTLSFGTGREAAPLRAECVTPSYFPLLGAAPRLGRGFTDADDGVGAPRTIVLSHGFWSRQLGADPDALGRMVTVGDRAYEVIGVAPHGFTGVDLGAVDAWMLLAASPEACSFVGRNLLRSGSSWLRTVGRLRDGASLPEASAELAAVLASPDRSRVLRGDVRLFPRYTTRRWSLAQESRLALWLAGGAGVLLLLACANVAGLLWSQTIARGREIAVRLQLGASRRRVFQQIMIETLLHAAAGAVAALLAARWLGGAVFGFFPFGADAPLLESRTVLVVAALAFGSGIVSGFVPAVHAARLRADGHRRTGHTVAGGRLRAGAALLVAQVGLALVLMAAAGLFVASVQNFRRDFAYDLDRVVVASIDFRRSPDKSPQEVYATYARLLDRVRQLPQVETAALGSAPVLESGGFIRTFFMRRPGGPSFGHTRAEVTPEYFATLGLRLVAGRGFQPAGGKPDRPPVILDETLARALFGSDDPIGQCVLVGSLCYEVVGITEVFRAALDPSAARTYSAFVPMEEDTADIETTPHVLLIRTREDAAGPAGAIAGVLQGASPDLPYVNVRPLLDLADVQARSWLLGATVFGLFGTMAVVLAGIGIYGALAFAIRQRTVEIGVRMALGATRGDIAGLVLRYGAVVLAAGLLLGFAGAFGASRFIEALLFNVAPADPVTFAMASAVVIFAVFAGCLVPALRAARTDPALALRYE